MNNIFNCGKVFALMSLIIISCGANNNPTNEIIQQISQSKDLKDNELKGNVKSVEIKTYLTEFRFGEVIKTTISNQKKYDFDAYGNIIKSYSFIKDDFYLVEEILYEDRRRTKVITYDYELGATIKVATTFVKKLFYNKENKINKEIVYDETGVQLYFTDFYFDKKGRDLGWKNYYGVEFNEKLAYQFIKSYNDDGTITEIETMPGLEKKWLIKRDSNNNELERWFYSSKGLKEKMFSKKYDATGKITFSETFTPNSPPTICKYIYDSEGNNVQIQYNSQGDIENVNYLYELDGNKNWVTKKNIYEKEKPLIIERTIIYYDDNELHNGRL